MRPPPPAELPLLESPPSAVTVPAPPTVAASRRTDPPAPPSLPFALILPSTMMTDAGDVAFRRTMPPPTFVQGLQLLKAIPTLPGSFGSVSEPYAAPLTPPLIVPP